MYATLDVLGSYSRHHTEQRWGLKPGWIQEWISKAFPKHRCSNWLNVVSPPGLCGCLEQVAEGHSIEGDSWSGHPIGRNGNHAKDGGIGIVSDDFFLTIHLILISEVTLSYYLCMNPELSKRWMSFQELRGRDLVCGREVDFLSFRRPTLGVLVGSQFMDSAARCPGDSTVRIGSYTGRQGFFHHGMFFYHKPHNIRPHIPWLQMQVATGCVPRKRSRTI